VRPARLPETLALWLSDWFCTDPKEPRLLQLLDQLDPDPDRAALRSAIQAGDETRVRSWSRSSTGRKFRPGSRRRSGFTDCCLRRTASDWCPLPGAPTLRTSWWPIGVASACSGPRATRRCSA